MNNIARIIFFDILKSKITLIYFIVLSLVSWISFLLEDSVSKGLLTVMYIVLFSVPLMALLYSTIYIYNSKEFITLLLSQPIKRGNLWSSLYAGVSASLCLAFLLGAGIPIIVYSFDATGFLLLAMGTGITLVSVSLAFLIAVLTDDKSVGIGLSILLWLFFTLLYDAVMMFLLFQFSDYPIEALTVLLLMLNPVDLARLQIMFRLDISAMLGYSGAVFTDFLGTTLSTVLSFVLLIAWMVAPYRLSLKIFRKKDIV
ncbi:ABC transporter permease subunit [uncultured Proteiniphilum sp.]|uniref:ABC transporter permease subunit n=1 Tax=uncultured Proteiniphilum sp. TaxID=497637 RepID=UPI0026024813|nr:ABC transporter permease subunit [uncultured Proteiniphilum sp.]